MKIIITKKFENNFLKTFKKYFRVNDLVKVLKVKSHIFISFHDPFYKLKTKINLVEFRGVFAVINKNKTYIVLLKIICYNINIIFNIKVYNRYVRKIF